MLFAGAEDARDVLVRELGAEFVPLYRTRRAAARAFPDADLVVLASASAARASRRSDGDRPCVSIGPVTSRGGRATQASTSLPKPTTHDLDGSRRSG